jgi:hypothetical protein
MNEAAFARAALPAATRILGFALRPYSLGHELILMRSGNLAIQHRADPEAMMAALPEAVAICSRDWNGYLNRGRERWLRLKFLRLDAAVRTYDLLEELAKFREYLQASTIGLRVNSSASSHGAPSRYLGTPRLLLLHQFVLSLPAVEWQVYGDNPWDYPYALAQMRHDAVHELAGDLEVENEIEREAREAAEEWERDHPESTLKLMKD